MDGSHTRHKPNKSLLSYLRCPPHLRHPYRLCLCCLFFVLSLSFFSSIWTIPTHLSPAFLTPLHSLLTPAPLTPLRPSIAVPFCPLETLVFIYRPHATPDFICSCGVCSFLRSSTLDSGEHPHIPFHPQDGILLLPLLPMQNRHVHLILPRMGHCRLAHPLSKSHLLCLSSGDSAHFRHPHLLRRRRRAH